MSSVPNSMYDEFYYRSHCGPIPYDASEEHWGRFFGAVADSIVRQLGPVTVLDVGCAKGFLVDAFHQRGVEAWGVDISEYAIDAVNPAIKSFVAVGAIGDPLPEAFPRRFDVLTCIETLEHLAADALRSAVGWLCSLSNFVVFSSTPDDFTEPTHVSVLPQEEWSALFAEFGFFRSFDLDVRVLTSWAVVYERRPRPASALVRDYERQFLWADRERHALRADTVRRNAQMEELDARLRELESNVEAEVERRAADVVNERASAAESRAKAYEAELKHANEELERSRQQLAEAKLDLLAERDRLIGVHAEAEQARRRLEAVTIRLDEVAANQAPLVAAARQLEATMQSETWRVGRAVIRPVRWLRRLLGARS